MSINNEETLKPSIVLVSTSELEEEVKKVEEKLKSLEDSHNKEFEKIKAEIDTLHTLTSWLNIAKSQGLWKSRTCKHVINDACVAWSIAEPEKVGIPSDAVVVTENGSKKVVVTKFFEICITCPLYEPKKM
ncbi:MAG: hypothetical protein RXQ80_03955 [Sulfolobaceae archaeon]|jgi:hypothetical protein|nr:hypothetical protein [Sulfolobaceae archaeon]PVU68108.1 hypothetical protein DDW01_00895 [Sulfolobus sp. SCGC AB-777_G05]